jgi:hypothetical protein
MEMYIKAFGLEAKKMDKENTIIIMVSYIKVIL